MLIVPSVCGAAESLAVVVAAEKTQVSYTRAELAQIYRSKISVDLNGQRIVPVNLPVGHPARESFSVAVLGRPPQELQAYWNQQYFLGKKPPVVLDSEEAVIRFVATTPGAIGYIFQCSVDQRVRVIDEIPIGDLHNSGFSTPACNRR
ncbi:MAG: hypothetical protein U1F34_03915 [Gammaproteobacteria bacterium]